MLFICPSNSMRGTVHLCIWLFLTDDNRLVGPSPCSNLENGMSTKMLAVVTKIYFGHFSQRVIVDYQILERRNFLQGSPMIIHNIQNSVAYLHHLYLKHLGYNRWYSRYWYAVSTKKQWGRIYIVRWWCNVENSSTSIWDSLWHPRSVNITWFYPVQLSR